MFFLEDLMAFLTVADLSRVALDRVLDWGNERRAALAAGGQRLGALVAFGPLVQGTSTEALHLLEIIDPLSQGSHADITQSISLDPRFFGRVTLTSLSSAAFRAVVGQPIPMVIHLLDGYRILHDEVGANALLATAQRALPA